jgi:hypothetical protein
VFKPICGRVGPKTILAKVTLKTENIKISTAKMVLLEYNQRFGLLE